MSDYPLISEKLKIFLNLAREPVGVRFLFSERDYQHNPCKELPAKIAYCVMVRKACDGRHFKVRDEHFRCLSGARALGVLDADEYVMSGQHFSQSGLYEDLCVSHDVQQQITFMPYGTTGVEIGPLKDFEREPHVILLLCTPYAAMRTVQGYVYKSGVQTAIRMAGNQAICSECTAVPHTTGSINLSMLCTGTRFMAKWRDDEMAIGIPYPRLADLLEGIEQTINPTETDQNKKRIYAHQQALGVTLEERYGDNYCIRTLKRWNDEDRKKQGGVQED